ncbi:MAG TPA: hypothetical protein VFS39_11540 [Nitrospira sp.]|nr:hypothetical protein [Nitrospira sp.]
MITESFVKRQPKRHGAAKRLKRPVAAVPLLLGLWVSLASCVTRLPALPDTVPQNHPLAVGHVQTVLLGPTSRWNLPELRFFEVTQAETGRRVRITVDRADGWFLVPLEAGSYALDRIIFNEGAFQEASQLGLHFDVLANGVTYVGTWRFGLESPHIQRHLVWSRIMEPDQVVREELRAWPTLHDQPLLSSPSLPATGETRLYELPPYPRVWFFRRQQTT